MKDKIIFIIIVGLLVVAFSCSKSKSDFFTNPNNADTILIYNNLHSLYKTKSSNSDSIITLLKIVKQKAEKNGYENGSALASYFIGNKYYDKNDYKKSLSYFSESKNLSQSSGFTLLEAQSLERLASLNLTLSNPNQAFDLYLESLKKFEIVNHKPGIAKVYNILGVYYTHQRKFDTAESYLSKAIALNKEYKAQHELNLNRGNLAILYHKKGLLKNAEDINNQLLIELQKTQDLNNFPIILDNLAEIKLDKKMPDSALFLKRKAIEWCKQYHDTSLISELYFTSALILKDQKDYDQAKNYLKKAEYFAKAINDPIIHLKSIETMLAIDTLTGITKSTLHHTLKMLQLKDSVNMRKNKNRLRELEYKYESELKNKELLQQKSELEHNKAKSNVLIIISALLTISIVFLILSIRFKKQNFKLKQEMLVEKLNNTELTLKNTLQVEQINKLKLISLEEKMRAEQRENLKIAMKIEQKNILLSDITSKIPEQNSVQNLDYSYLASLKSTIREHLKDNAKKDLFNQKFNNLHPEFFSKVKNTHPQLTKNEIKYLAFLKLDLDNNQISEILNITYEAIKKTRYRIRKKIMIDRTISLEDYISNF